jgi:hypothetical protein
MGTLMVLGFLVQTIVALVQRPSVSLGFWEWVAAAETAAWRLKWVAIPVTIVVFWAGWRIYRSIRIRPARFCGLGYARVGLMASAGVPLLIALFIGITVPRRLQHRREGIKAGFHAQLYAIDRVLLDYRARFGTLPTELKDLKRLPDPDGAIAAALANIDPTGYKTSADVAALPKAKPRTLRGAVLRNVSTNIATEDILSGGLSFTNYELRVPGADRILGTEDDLLVRDGIITEAPQQTKSNTGAAAGKSIP